LIGALVALSLPAHAQVRYTFKDLGTLGGRRSLANGINAAGDVVGRAAPAGADDYSGHHAFLYRDGVMSDLGVPFGESSEARAINSSGQIIVNSRSSTGQRAFLRTNGVYADLGSLGGPTISAKSLND
jgi:probable HAF family extracellular repeat protein